MKTIYNKFDKTEIADLPLESFPGRIVIIDNEQDCIKATSYLQQFDILGIDTETRPSFHKGIYHKVALLQISTENEAFLFRLNQIGLPQSVIALFESNIKKIGLSLKDDIHMMTQRHTFIPNNFIDLQQIAGDIGIEDKALQTLYANLFHLKISKRQRLSNWEAKILTMPQQLYAATDAWACINLYKEIMRLKQTHDYKLILNTTDVPVGADHSQSSQD